MPYGFPSGNQLIESIYELAIHNSPILKKFGFKESEIKLFADELFNSQLPSIDLFLERRLEFFDIGKLCIAICIGKCENESNLILPPLKRKGIYHYLFSKMVHKCSEITNNKISFITFNYDRSLEHFLQVALTSATDAPLSSGSLELLGLPITHVHGSLGDLPWQNQFSKKYEPFSISSLSDEKIRGEILQASKNIKVISEREKSKEYEQAKEIIHGSENIIFIGFSFHNEILDRLDFGNLKIVDNDSSFFMLPNVKCGMFRGSSLGMGKAERKVITNKYKIFFPHNSENHSGLEFLKDFVPIK